MTRIRTPSTEEALAILSESSQAHTLESAANLFEAALAFAREHLRLDEIELKDLFELVKILDSHASWNNVEDAEEDVEDGDASAPAPPAGRKLYMQVPIPDKASCKDPSCILHHGTPTSEDLRRYMLGLLEHGQFRVEGTSAEYLRRVLNAATTKFRIDGRHLYVIADRPEAPGDPNPGSNLN